MVTIFLVATFLLFFYLNVLIFNFCFIWIRGTFPRYRYNKLLCLSWKLHLPLILFYFMIFICFKIFLYFIFF